MRCLDGQLAKREGTRMHSAFTSRKTARVGLRTADLSWVGLMAALVACGSSKPTGSQYLGKWEGSIESITGSDGRCHQGITKLNESFLIKSERQTNGNCANYGGIFTLTPEGNLKGGPMDMIVISFDQTKNVAVVSMGGELHYLTKAPLLALNEGDEFLGKWQAFYTSEGADAPAAYDYGITRESGNFRVSWTSRASSQPESFLGKYSDGRIVGEGLKDSEFGGIVTPFVQILPDGNLRTTLGEHELRLKKPGASGA